MSTPSFTIDPLSSSFAASPSPSPHLFSSHHINLHSAASSSFSPYSAVTLSSSRRTEFKAGCRYAGGYEVGPVLGVGTYGEVRFGRSVDSPEAVALKLIDMNRFTEETAALVRKEIGLLALLDHPNVIRLIEVREDVAYTGEWCDHCACTTFFRGQAGVCANCQHQGSEHTREETRPVLMIVQELAAGGELFGLLMHTGPFYEDQARYYFQQLIFGLEHCHQQNVVHRDLKPENLCLDHEFTLKIIDFGLSSLEAPIATLQSLHARHNLNNTSVNSSPVHSTTSAAITALPTANALLYEREVKDREIHRQRDRDRDEVQSSATIEGGPDSAGHHSRSLSSSTSESFLSRQRSRSFDGDSLNLIPHPHQFSGVGSIPYAPAEVFYVHSIYNHRGYRGALADIWSSAVILFVMLLGRPPFMRPLHKTYGHAMRRCRHFVSIMNGEGFGSMSQGAKELIQKMMRFVPDDRIGFAEIKADPWFNGPLPSIDELKSAMQERCSAVWRKTDKMELNELMLTMIGTRNDGDERPSAAYVKTSNLHVGSRVSRAINIGQNTSPSRSSSRFSHSISQPHFLNSSFLPPADLS